MSLRKQKIDQYIFNKKERILERKIGDKSSLEIDPEKLNLPAEIINYDVTDIVRLFISLFFTPNLKFKIFTNLFLMKNIIINNFIFIKIKLFILE